MNKKTFAVLILAAAFLLNAGESYTFFAISDTHFGMPENYAKPAPGTNGWFCRDPKRTVTALPVYKALFDDISAKAADDSFLIQCGDLIDGRTTGFEAHKKELVSALELLKKHIKIKIYHVNGNHEDIGDGGRKAFKEVLMPAISESAGKKLVHGNYTFTRGQDLFIVLNWSGNAKWKDFLKKTLDALNAKPRRLFVVIHTPFIENWNPVPSAEALEMLLPYDAIIISGHIHSNMIATYEKDGHVLTQVTLSTRLPERPVGKIVCAKNRMTLETFKKMVLAREERALREAAQKAQQATQEAQKTALEARKATLEARKEAMAKILSNVTAYAGVSGCGYAKFEVSDGGVTIFYQGTDLAKKPAKFALPLRPATPEQK